MHKMLFLVSLNLIIFFPSCVSVSKYNSLSSQGEAFWLATSLYEGPFYDDREYRLINHRPFFTINGRDINGNLLTPSKEASIIPAGTIVEILDIIYPTSINLLKRSLYMPRENIYVIFRVGLERASNNFFHNKMYIMVLPIDIVSKAQVYEYLSKFLSKEDPNPWILTQRKHIQEAIFKKNPVIGMTDEQLIKTLGYPNAKKKVLQHYKEGEEVWEYDNYSIFITSQKISNFYKRVRKK